MKQPHRSRRPSARTAGRAALALATVAVLGLTSTPTGADARVAPILPPAEAETEASCVPSLIDDFSAGAYRSADLVSGVEDAVRAAPVLGGRRFTRFQSGPSNPYGMPATLSVPATSKAPLVVSAGYRGVVKLQVHYGAVDTGVFQPLNADLSCYQSFRVRFVATDLDLNVVLQIKSASSPVVYQCAFNTVVTEPTGFVLEFKRSCFVTNDPAHPPVDWTDVDRVMLQVQPASVLKSNDYAISRIWLAGSPLPEGS